MKTLSPSAILEIRRIKTEIDTILAKPGCTRADGKRVDAMIAQISAIKEAGITDLDSVRARVDEIGATITAEQRAAQIAHEKIFRSFMSGVKDEEIAQEVRFNENMLAGQQTISFTAGTEGGVTVPMSFQRNVELGLAATDPLLDPNVASVVTEPSLMLRPLQLPGWDLSTIAAVRAGEAGVYYSGGWPAGPVPQVDQQLLNAYTYRLAIAASYEFEEDVFDSAMARLGEAYGVGFARGVGYDLVNGSGTNEPQGIYVGATAAPGVGTLPNPLTPVSLTDLYFSVNKIYRNNPKCAWLMADNTYQNVRKMVDTNGRPVLNMVDDKETILGKPVHITPSLRSGGSNLSVGGGVIIFGDLSHFHVHVSSLYLRRNWQLPNYVEFGRALYTGIMRCDSVLHDPTGGAMPPIVYAPVSA